MLPSIIICNIFKVALLGIRQNGAMVALRMQINIHVAIFTLRKLGFIVLVTLKKNINSVFSESERSKLIS